MIGFLRRRRRRRARARVFPAAWREILERRVPYVRCLPAAERERLCGHIKVFLEEKRFEGAGGIEVTDEMRVTIAAQACVLLAGRDEPSFYPTLKTIIVYPAAYQARYVSPFAGGLTMNEPGVRLGESWHRGAVVLSWRDVVAGAEEPCDGRNVVFHEFAHQLDGEWGGGVQGAPALDDPAQYGPWSRILGAEFWELIEDITRGRPHLIRDYGATNPAEFFAVITEHFFEQSVALRERHPELYEQLRTFYRQDPAEWKCAEALTRR